MNMLVCIKQVPDTTEIKINPETNTLIREGVPSVVNPFDAYALECAAKLKDANPGSKIVVCSMGPEQAKTALKECLSVGGDKAYLINGKEFGGSDTLATGYALATAKAKIEELEDCKFDVVFCGKQAIDGDTAQTGPQLAENLGLPQVSYAYECWMQENGKLKVKQESEDGFEIMELPIPCLITVTKPDYEPRYATIKTKMAANKAKIEVLTAEDAGIDTGKVGLKNSATRVIKTFSPPRKTGGVIIKEETNEESAAKLFEVLRDKSII